MFNSHLNYWSHSSPAGQILPQDKKSLRGQAERTSIKTASLASSNRKERPAYAEKSG
jgi:hypothetical protein